MTRQARQVERHIQHGKAGRDIDKKGLLAITTDNGSNIIKAVELNEWLRMQCFGHRLHLAIGRCQYYLPKSGPHHVLKKRICKRISNSKFVCLLILISEYIRIFIHHILTIKSLQLDLDWASRGLFTGVAMVTGLACNGLLGI